ncbi:MAG: PEP-CTERM sorting domain-containing protein [Isosphaeraceae bacterium]
MPSQDGPRRGWLFCSLAVAALLAAGGPARADISFVSAFRNVSNVQTGNGNTLSAAGAFYSADLTSTTANNYSAVQMVFPGAGSPVALSQTDLTLYHFQTNNLGSKAAMDAAFPVGTYTFNATRSGGVDTTSYQYTTDDYAQSQPFLTGNDYASLQGMNAAQAFVFHFSPFVTGSRANSSFIFFTIFDNDTNKFVFDAGFLAPTTTSVTLAANTLAAGHHYTYEIDFSNRDLVDSPGAEFQAQLGFDVRTTGTFVSAVPEPSTLALCAIGLVGLAAARFRNGRAVNR